MADLFRGYLPAKGKRPLESVKSGNFMATPPERGDYVGVLKHEYIQVDVDEKALADKVLEIIRNENVKCDVLETSRGYHFYFLNTNVKSQSVHKYSACGIPCDYGLGSKDRVVPLRITKEILNTKIVNGQEVETIKQETTERSWLQTYEHVDELPCWLYPVSVQDKKVMEITTRNQSLFTYILTLQQVGLTKDEVRKTINIINRYILKEPLPQREVDTITRDEAFIADLFYDGDGKFLHNVFGDYLLNNANIVMVNGQCNIYTKTGLYSNDPMDFERVMIDKIPGLKDAQRKEVYKYLCLKCWKEAEFADPKFIGMKTSVYDMETGEFKPYAPDVLIQNKIDFDYDPDAYCEVMDKTLDKVCCHDKDLRSLLEEMIGYTLYRSNSMQKCFILTGEGSNGKSTILNCIKKLLGKQNFTSLDLRELEDSFKPSEMYNKLANIGDDISAKFIDNSSTFKKCVTGESFMAQRKYAQPFALECYATQIFCANELPAVADKSDGFARRIILVPFNAKFSKKDADYDPFIESKLLTEESMQYLLKLAIEGLRRVLTNKSFTISSKSEQDKKEYMKYNNNVLDWLEGNPKIENESINDVYLAYQVWCRQNGCQSVKKLNLSKEIKKLGYGSEVRSIDGKSVRIYVKGDANED